MNKYFLNFFLILLAGCSGNQNVNQPKNSPGTMDNQVTWCSTPDAIGCATVYLLVYGTIAVVKYIQNIGPIGQSKARSIPDAIFLNCYIQSPDKSYLSPCGPFTVEMNEIKLNKRRNYSFTGDENQIGFIKGRNKLSIRLTSCGLTQEADEVKAGDIIKLEFPAVCGLKNQ